VALLKPYEPTFRQTASIKLKMAVIEFNHVTKAYRLGQRRGSLREAIASTTSNFLKRTSKADSQETFLALNDVSFKVQPGETLGIIGHNGAGKSTSLKLLSRVTYPTSGSIHTTGRIAALIELGAGFHSELSGRENIYLNASILGLKRREIDAKFDSIVEFAGLGKFIDTPVKRYSSGMYVRLAFAVASHVRADILLVDEVLAVGDTAFQQKCMDKMQEMRNQGTTIVLVSHNLWTVDSFCTRAMLVRAGQIEADGKPGDVIQVYRQYERQDLLADGKEQTSEPASAPAPADPASNQSEPVIPQVELRDAAGEPSEAFDSWSKITMRVHFSTPNPIDRPLIAIHLYRSDGLLCNKIMNNHDSWFETRRLEGEGSFDVTIGPLPLVPDNYMLEAHIMDSKKPIVYASSSRVPFRINGILYSLGEGGVFWVESYWHQPENLVIK
jgi:lipopolysaccharide transport system ATP-binding protein